VNGREIDLGPMSVECYAVAVGDEPKDVGIVDQRAELAQRPSERSARVVGTIPEQVAQPLAEM
jgi:hypothetical protein